MKVFVASARRDAVEQYRQVAIEVIHEIKDADDTRWTAVCMEDHGYTGPAETFTTAEWGPEKIKNCDAVVLIVTWKYGSLIPGEGISYTEREFRAALDNQKRVFAWCLPPQPPMANGEQNGMLTQLLFEYVNDPQSGEAAKAFIERVWDSKGVFAHPLPLELETNAGFRTRLRGVLEQAFLQERSSSLTLTGPKGEPAQSDEIVSVGVRVAALTDRVTVTWESSLQKGREHIRPLSTSWPADRPTVLAVRRASHDAAYVVVGSNEGGTIVRVRQDGTAREAALAVPFSVTGARLGRGSELGTVTLQSATGQVTTFRTDELQFGEAWRTDDGPQ